MYSNVKYKFDKYFTSEINKKKSPPKRGALKEYRELVAKSHTKQDTEDGIRRMVALPQLRPIYFLNYFLSSYCNTAIHIYSKINQQDKYNTNRTHMSI